MLEKCEAFGCSQTVPIIFNIEQAAALGAGDMHFINAKRCAASRTDAPLKSG